MLFNGLLHIMLWEGWTQPDWIAHHTTGFDELKGAVRESTPELVAQTCGLRKEDLFTAAKWFATSPARAWETHSPIRRSASPGSMPSPFRIRRFLKPERLAAISPPGVWKEEGTEIPYPLSST